MFEWSEEQRIIRDTVRQFVEAEIAPRREEFEFGDTPPYEVLRKLYRTFGLDVMARDQFKRRLEAKEVGGSFLGGDSEEADPKARAIAVALPLIPIIELCRHSPGMVTALGVSVGLTSAAIMSRGTPAQQERWALDLLTLDKIGAWAITEPNSGSDAFGSMTSTARRDGDEYARDRVQFGKPIGEFQLVQEKLAHMEVARLNVENLLFRYIETLAHGRQLSLGEASAMKLYSSHAAVEVSLEAVQLFGGNGYMAEYQVEQLARDAKVLEIYAGTNEIQMTHIAKDLLRR